MQRLFIEMQFRAQQSAYASTFPDATHWLVSADGRPAGRLIVDHGPHEHVVVDIVVLSDHRRRGIGTSLMGEVLADARAAGVPLRLTVRRDDTRLVGWYESLGLSIVDHGDMDLMMVWAPDCPHADK